MVVEFFSAPDGDVLVFVQSTTRRFETLVKIKGDNHCKYILQCYAWLFTFDTYSLIRTLNIFKLLPKALKTVPALFLSLLVLLTYINKHMKIKKKK